MPPAEGDDKLKEVIENRSLCALNEVGLRIPNYNFVVSMSFLTYPQNGGFPAQGCFLEVTEREGEVGFLLLKEVDGQRGFGGGHFVRMKGNFSFLWLKKLTIVSCVFSHR